MIEDFQQSMVQFKDRLNKIETNNEELASRVGVFRFEKNQIMNILNSINFGIIITDIQDNVSHINDYMLKLFNKTRHDVIDRPLEEVIQYTKTSYHLFHRQETFEDSKDPTAI